MQGPELSPLVQRVIPESRSAPQAAGLSGNYLNDVVSGTVETAHVVTVYEVEFALFARWMSRWV